MFKRLFKKQQNPIFTEPKIIETKIPGMASIKLKSYYDEFIWYYPDCEPVTKKWFVDNAKSDWHIFDCGANIGYYSILFSKLAPRGQIYAFEPTETVKKLEDNLSYNGIGNVKIFKKALGFKSGKQTENIYRIWGNEPERIEYDFTTLDEFVKSEKITKLDCIKIDVDSFDFEVLQGAEKILEDFNPYVVVELNHALSRRCQSNMRALEWMYEHGYTNTVCLEYENFVFKKGVSCSGKNEIKVSFIDNV